MGKYKIGLLNIKMGPIASDGDAGTALVAVGDTVAGSATMTTEESQVQDFNIEESDSPVLSIKTEPDSISLNWSTFANDAATLQKLFGGTITPAVTGGGSPTGEIWNAPDVIPEIEQTIEAEWKQGGKVIIARAKISASLNTSFKRDTLSQIDIVARVLQPTKAGVSRLRIVNGN